MYKGLSFLAAVVWTASAFAQAHTWEVQKGGSVVEIPPATTMPAADPVVQNAQQDLDANRPAAAKEAILPWIIKHPDSPLRDRAVFILANANYQLGSHVQAFYNCDELLDFYPASPFYQPALQLQYKIADDYLNGYKENFLFGLKFFTSEERGLQMLYRIQQRVPGSPIAEKAMLRTADYYYDNGDDDLAQDAYGALTRFYPRSENVPIAMLQQAKSNMRQYYGPKFDATPIKDARQILVNLKTRFPAFASQQNTDQLISRIDAELAKKDYWTATFFRKTHNPTAAAMLFHNVIKQYPDSSEAAAAQRDLDSMGNVPPPAVAHPSTRPASRPASLPEGEVLP